MLKGTFTRKDNGKTLITTRKIIGDELVQVSCMDYDISLDQNLCISCCLTF